jgi:Na+/proline symporter
LHLFFVLSIYLVIGTCLFVFFFTNPQAALPEKLEGIFPHFIGHQMPHTLRGLVVAAIVLASIDSPLMSLTSSFVTDIYKPLIRSDATESEYMSLSRKLIFGFGLLLGVIALAFSQLQNLLWLAFKIGGITFGSMLGVFLLGLLTKRKANASNMVGMIGMAVINLGLLIASEQKWIPLGWTWLVILGTLGTFGCGYLLSQPETPKKQTHLA